MESKRTTIFEILGPFTAVSNEFLNTTQGLSINARFLFILLQKRVNHNRPEKLPCPSYATLMKEMGCSRGTLARALNELSEAGWIERKRRFNNSNEYIIAARSKPVVPDEPKEDAVMTQSCQKLDEQSCQKLDTNKTVLSTYVQEQENIKTTEPLGAARAPDDSHAMFIIPDKSPKRILSNVRGASGAEVAMVLKFLEFLPLEINSRTAGSQITHARDIIASGGKEEDIGPAMREARLKGFTVVDLRSLVKTIAAMVAQKKVKPVIVEEDDVIMDVF